MFKFQRSFFGEQTQDIKDLHPMMHLSQVKWFTKQDFLCATLKSNRISIVVYSIVFDYIYKA